MKTKLFITSLCLIFSLNACNKHNKRYDSHTTINPELLGKWVSIDNCTLEFSKHNNTLILVNYTNNKKPLLQNIPLQFKIYNIETILSNKTPTSTNFRAQYIDGSIIIPSCQILHKVSD